ncbi:MAG TPA: thiamine pyrophosphate-dependent dehydrogenase E1 component subunit alpha [Gemmatimonadaceae bacterium]|nr:thiamine pyrophosphate-dependent dehydrogenase E1 component subunit alpha [Gemmatimonadaceae bacterium]
MQRFAAFDPPEYTAWTRVDSDVDAFRETLARDAARAAVVDALDESSRLALYRGLVRNRLTDVALKRMVRQGVISKAWLGTGEEAATIGPVHALRRGPVLGGVRDVAAPMIRNGGACLEMGMTVADTLRAYMGTADGPSHGRDGHYGDLAQGVLAPISHVGDVVPVVTGVALSFRLRRQDAVAMTWIGDGSTKAGVAHEGLNFAAVQRAPVVFIIQNNQVALGTKLEQHHAAAGRGNFADWPKAYGMWGGVFDGNNVLDAYAAAALAVARCRRGEGPALLIAETFRMGGHATHDEAEARQTFSPSLFSTWGRRDPVALYEEYLCDAGVARARLEKIAAHAAAEVERGEAEALESRAQRMPNGASALDGVYAASDS